MGQPEERETLWSYAESEDAEGWRGRHATKELAIEAAHADEDITTDFFVMSWHAALPERFFARADWLVEDAAETAYDQCDENAEGWPDAVTVEARDELDALIKVWARKHFPCNFCDPDTVKVFPVVLDRKTG
jgi:hypothetical protein